MHQTTLTLLLPLLLLLLALPACSTSPETSEPPAAGDASVTPDASISPDTAPTPDATPSATGRADVRGVTVSGEAGSYSFSVTLESPDTGCDGFADWWEVVDAGDGALLYRRVLLHSHVDEQPFVRSGGPVAIDGAREVVVRGHFSAGGYGGAVFKGSVEGGFAAGEVAEGFGAAAESAAPLPTGCAF